MKFCWMQQEREGDKLAWRILFWETALKKLWKEFQSEIDFG